MARRLLERFPAQEVRLNLRGQLLDEPRRPAAGDEFLDTLDTNEIDHGCLSGRAPLRPGPRALQPCSRLARLKYSQKLAKTTQHVAHYVSQDWRNDRSASPSL